LLAPHGNPPCCNPRSLPRDCQVAARPGPPISHPQRSPPTMANFPFHTPESAPAAAQPVLADANARFGFVPNLYAGLAEAPPVLHAYLGLAQQFATTSLSPIEREVVSLAASAEHQCTFCVAAHSMLATSMAGM